MRVMIMDTIEAVIIIAACAACIAVGIVYRKAGMLMKITLDRLGMFFIIILGLYSWAKGYYYGICTASVAFIGSIIGSVFTDKLACPECGRRYGIRIWFRNSCPHCGVRLK